jgi:hypothetical protein
MDRETSSRCRLTHTEYVGPRDLMNYCEDFRMLRTTRSATARRKSSSRVHAGEQLCHALKEDSEPGRIDVCECWLTAFRLAALRALQSAGSS